MNTQNHGGIRRLRPSTRGRKKNYKICINIIYIYILYYTLYTYKYVYIYPILYLEFVSHQVSQPRSPTTAVTRGNQNRAGDAPRTSATEVGTDQAFLGLHLATGCGDTHLQKVQGVQIGSPSGAFFRDLWSLGALESSRILKHTGPLNTCAEFSLAFGEFTVRSMNALIHLQLNSSPSSQVLSLSAQLDCTVHPSPPSGHRWQR